MVITPWAAEHVDRMGIDPRVRMANIANSRFMRR